MIKPKYLKQIKNTVRKLNKNKNWKVFLFGSSLTRERFGDCDIGIVGNVEDREISQLKQAFEDSTLPYFVDIVNFNKVSKQFKDNVFSGNKILWITR